MAAAIVDSSGHGEMIRLVPTPEPGVFEGDVSAASTGLHNIRVSADNGAAADSILMVEADASRPHRPRLTDLAGLTGGVSVDATDIQPLIRHLSTMPRPSREETVYPMRSAWWMIPFAVSLCAEWLIRRRRSER
jgi:hypothetical protein